RAPVACSAARRRAGSHPSPWRSHDGGRMTLTNFRKAGHWPTLLAAFLYFDVSFCVWYLLGPLANFVAEELHLSATQTGFLVATPLLGGSVLRMVMGTLTDRLGPRRTGLLGIALTFVPLALGWLFADSLPRLFLMALLLGVPGASFAVALPLASRWYPPRYQGLVMGIAGAGNSGTVLASLFLPRLATAWGWHAAIGVIAGSFMRPVGGALADRFGGSRVLTLLYGAVGCLLLGIATLPPLWAATSLFTVTMALLGAGNGSVFQLVPLRFRRQLGVVTGLVGAAGGLGGFFLPSLLGLLRDRTGTYSSGLVLLAVVCAAGMASILFVGRTWRLAWAIHRGAPVAEGSRG